MDLTDFSLRYAIICAMALIAVYMLISLLSLSRLKRRKPALPKQPAVDKGLKFDADGIYSLKRSQPMAMFEEPEPARGQQPSEKEEPQFGEQLFRSGVEAELQQMRNEVAELKETIAQLQAARRVSPQYSEAMVLAQRGMDKQDIAEECGISIGEAELVLALSRNKQEYEEHDR